MTTTTSFSGQTYAMCLCCARHGKAKLLPTVVTCPECGYQCSCEGCVAEWDEPVLRKRAEEAGRRVLEKYADTFRRLRDS